MAGRQKVSKTPEGAILQLILDWLKAEHILAFRNNVLAMPTADGKRFIKAGTPGMADILAFDDWQPASISARLRLSVPTWIEVKAKGGKQSELQKSFQEQVESHGHRYIVAHSLEDAQEALK
jgi:hypothetical protein